MTVHCMSNPHAFVKEAKKVGVTYTLLQEAIKCLGEQATARMFAGKCKRGGGNTQSSASIKNWMATFQYAQDHPDEEDKDPYQARKMEPFDEWHNFVKIVKTPISEEDQEMWSKLPPSSLGDNAIKHGITLGVRNAKAVKNLLERMREMVERREKLFWNVDEIEENNEELNFRLMNVFKLRDMCKSRGIPSTHLKKDQMIELLNKYTENHGSGDTGVITLDYDSMTLLQLKNKAKEKGLVQYNNLKRNDLINALITVDKEEEKIVEEDGKLVLHGVTIIARKEDKYIDVTKFLKASGSEKQFSDWKRLKHSQDFLTKLSASLGIPRDTLILFNMGSNEVRSTWVHPRVAINIAQWVSSDFDVAVSGWIYQLLSEGSVKFQRPVKCLTNLTEIDIEAEEMEMEIEKEWSQYTNDCVLYMAYIGNGLVKIGYSDGKVVFRDLKHQSIESEYPQWRLIKLYKISGKPVEGVIHELLMKYRANFNKQKEIFKPCGTLVEFSEIIKQLLHDNDLKMRVQLLEKENSELKLKIAELKK